MSSLVGAPAALRLLLPRAEPREPLLQRLHVQPVLHVDADDAEARHLVASGGGKGRMLRRMSGRSGTGSGVGRR